MASCAPSQRYPAFDAHTASSLLSGRVSVVDGRTLLFPDQGRTVQLMNIDTCEVAQWAVVQSSSGPSPVPCGARAKAWLTRTVGTQSVDCQGAGFTRTGQVLAYCAVGGRDVALEMLRVGLAVIDTPRPVRAQYFAVQADAVAKRYGIWATFVLDMEEWRRRAVDQTPTRQPIADYNLLADRQRDVTPPMIESRHLPKTTSK
ncbi:MAG: thermonuclease family protein [Devosia sp.]|nr:thermonuclease family protein [Devosia sp.]